MGCGMRAWSDDEAELRRAVEKVGLKGDRKYDLGTTISNPYEETILRCARLNMDRTETIRAIIFDQHERMARAAFNAEMREREALEKLKATYG